MKEPSPPALDTPSKPKERWPTREEAYAKFRAIRACTGGPPADVPEPDNSVRPPSSVYDRIQGFSFWDNKLGFFEAYDYLSSFARPRTAQLSDEEIEKAAAEHQARRIDPSAQYDFKAGVGFAREKLSGEVG